MRPVPQLSMHPVPQVLMQSLNVMLVADQWTCSGCVSLLINLFGIRKILVESMTTDVMNLTLCAIKCI